MGDRAWKRTERAIAARLNGARIPVDGRGGRPDVDAGWLVVECKERKALPLWLKSALAQAVAAARPDQLPAVVLHELGARHSDDLVVMRLADFELWHGAVSGSGQ